MQLGVIGLGTMGANIARNAARNGAEVVVFNRTVEKVDAFMQAYSGEGTFVPCKTLQEFVAALIPPRPILLMVKAGTAVDQMIEELLPYLSKGDILIDAGNSHDIDTNMRFEKLAQQGIRFVGMGVSGGEEGALHGPSMMPGGDRSAVDHVLPLLLKMAAEDGEGGKCVTYIGPRGTGHFVKMVHNGIEYGIMQLLAECYHVLKGPGSMSNAAIADIFAAWNSDPWLQSFLLDITVRILRMKDTETDADLIDVIKDTAGQKGTGQWTANAALTYGIAVPTIVAAVEARIISSAKEFRVMQSTQGLSTVDEPAPTDLAQCVRAAYELSVLNTYAQGFQLLSVPSDNEKWGLSLSEIARLWRGGCIIRAGILCQWQQMFAGDPQAAEIVRERFAGERQRQWRKLVAFALLRGIPIPALAASLTYFDGYRTERLPQNLTQAQRDLFGAHTYERLDREGTFHTEWPPS